MSDMPWGFKLTASVYVEGDQTQGKIDAAMDWAGEDFITGIVFAGLRVEAVQDKPVDQGAT